MIWNRKPRGSAGGAEPRAWSYGVLDVKLMAGRQAATAASKSAEVRRPDVFPRILIMKSVVDLIA